MDGESVTKKTRPATNYYTIRDIVTSKTAAVGIAPLGLKTVKVSTPEIPKMIAPIIVVTKGEPSKKVMRLLEFYKSEYSFLTK